MVSVVLQQRTRDRAQQEGETAIEGARGIQLSNPPRVCAPKLTVAQKANAGLTGLAFLNESSTFPASHLPYIVVFSLVLEKAKVVLGF